MISSPTSWWPRAARRGFLHGWWIVLCLVLGLACRPAAATDIPGIPAVPVDGQEAWLLTFGPGQIYFESFGHNAIWLREPAIGLDHTFNFGNFAFEQKDFFLRFLRGRMLYFSLAQPAIMDFEIYQQENRDIRAQKLQLSTDEYERLRDYLVNEILPENRAYHYDYYLNNCSTRIRDAIDVATGGALRAHAEPVPAQLNFRDQTRRLTERQFWTYLGLEAALGYPVDRAVSRWDEMFIPMVLADEMALMPDGSGGKLVDSDIMVYTSTLPPPHTSPTPVWYRYLLSGLLIVALGWLSGRFMPPAWLRGLCFAWVLINATLGLVLASLWLFTDHAMSRENANLLLLNPLLLLALLPRLRRWVAALMVAGNLLAFFLLLLPEHQYNLDVLALLTPVNLGVAVFLIRSGAARPVKQRGLG